MYTLSVKDENLFHVSLVVSLKEFRRNAQSTHMRQEGVNLASFLKLLDKSLMVEDEKRLPRFLKLEFTDVTKCDEPDAAMQLINQIKQKL